MEELSALRDLRVRSPLLTVSFHSEACSSRVNGRISHTQDY